MEESSPSFPPQKIDFCCERIAQILEECKMNSKCVYVLTIVLIACLVSVSESASIEWPDHPDGMLHFYELIYNSPRVTWYEAKNAAEQQMFMEVNGYLATITSPEESSFITNWLSQLNPEYYILVGGYQDRDAPDYSEPAGGWRWVTGEPWVYTNWHVGEPSNGPPEEDVLGLKEHHGFYWNDGAAEVPEHYYLVEYSVPEPATIEAAIDIDPDTLNLKSKGRWITCYILLPEQYDVADIDSDSLLLNGKVSPAWSWIDEAEQILMAKFSRSEVQQILDPGQAELTVTGELTDGSKFEGTDTIKVIDKGKN